MKENSMNDFRVLFEESKIKQSTNLWKLDVELPLSVYYGMTENGHCRIAFMSNVKQPKMVGTKLIEIYQVTEGTDVYWTYIDLVDSEASQVFCIFCSALVECVSKCDNTKIALMTLQREYQTWKLLFRSERKQLTREQIQGLFGELYFLHVYLKDMIGIEKAVSSWSGPEATSKDFSFDKTWVEVKTVGALAESVKISSLAQLSAKEEGKLVLIRVEKMADEFSNGLSSVSELFSEILKDINGDEVLEKEFLMKMGIFNLDISDSCFKMKFSFKAINYYKVDDVFPRLTEEDITRPEITGVRYLLNIAMLDKYKVEE